MNLKNWLVNAIVLTLTTVASPTHAESISGRVIAVLDGDTIDILTHENTQPTPVRIRLADIDAPERGQPFGQASRKALAQVCDGKHAVVRVVDIDRHRRIVGRVTCDGTDTSASQIQRGMAWFLVQFGRDSSLREIELQARQARLGLWHDPDPTPPWVWRRSEQRK